MFLVLTTTWIYFMNWRLCIKKLFVYCKNIKTLALVSITSNDYCTEYKFAMIAMQMDSVNLWFLEWFWISITYKYVIQFHKLILLKFQILWFCYGSLYKNKCYDFMSKLTYNNSGYKKLYTHYIKHTIMKGNYK